MARLLVPVVVLVAALFAAGIASAQSLPECAADPGPIAESITNDAAIEVHGLRREVAANCAALSARLDELVTLQTEAVESETTTAAQRVALAPVDRNRLDLLWWGSWATVGMLFVLLAAPMFLRAFRFWQP